VGGYVDHFPVKIDGESASDLCKMSTAEKWERESRIEEKNERMNARVARCSELVAPWISSTHGNC